MGRGCFTCAQTKYFVL
uniref:Uncharacterized protein n=1 Tax=Anguilla anguilla TaxID=7936 RepID=A0A0E9VXI4_ANGAN